MKALTCIKNLNSISFWQYSAKCGIVSLVKTTTLTGTIKDDWRANPPTYCDVLVLGYSLIFMFSCYKPAQLKCFMKISCDVILSLANRIFNCCFLNRYSNLGKKYTSLESNSIQRGDNVLHFNTKCISSSIKFLGQKR